MIEIFFRTCPQCEGSIGVTREQAIKIDNDEYELACDNHQ